MSANEPTALAVIGAQPRALGALIPTSIDQAIQLAKLMSDGGLVPQHLQDKPANCLMVIEVAMRWGLSPFQVAQCTSVIQGKLMFEGKLVAAVVNSRGELAERLRYDYQGSGRDRTCRVYGRLRGEEQPREIFVTFGVVRSRNEVWDRQPDQQLAYYGTRVWARRHLPEVMLGVYGPDEPFEDEPQLTPEQEAWKNYKGPAAAPAPPTEEASPEAADPKAPTQTSSPSAPGVEPLGTAAPSTAKSDEPSPASELVTNLVKATFPGAVEREPVAGVDYEEWSEADPRVAEHYPADSEFRDMVECWAWKGARGNTKWGQGDGEWVSRGMEPQRSDAQNKLIHVLKKERGYDDKTWRAKLSGRFNKTTSADCSVREAGIIIDSMQRATEQHGTAEQKQAKQRARAGRMVEDIASELGARGIGPQDIENKG